MSSFRDLFAKQAACYAQCRPTYPSALFDYLSGLVKEHRLAWDVGTGNGQAAVGLAAHFDRVIATDGSEAQISHAAPHDRVEYHIALADQAGAQHGLTDGSADLVAIAQALHWFATDAFFANARRVLKPGGLIAAWCYVIHQVEPKIDAVANHFYRDITGPYWPSERKWIDENYETIPFPFDESESLSKKPALECREEWNLAQYVGYLNSWSAVQTFKDRNGYNPLDEIADDLTAAWGDAEGLRVAVWPIYMRIGRVR